LKRYVFAGDKVTGPDRRRILSGTLYSFLIQGISVMLVFVSNLWLVRSSDPDAYGLYVHIFNWVSLLAMVVLSGRNGLVLVGLPRYMADNHPARLTGLIRRANRWVFVAALAGAGLFSGIISVIPIRTLSEYHTDFLLAASAIYFTACLTLNQTVLQGLNHIRLSQVVEKILKPSLLIVGVVVSRFFLPRLNGQQLILLVSLVLAVCCVVIGYLVQEKTRPYRQAAGTDSSGTGLSGKAFSFFAIGFLALLSTRITMLMLPWYAPARDIGIFNIANRFSDLLFFPFYLMQYVLPQLFARHTRAEKAYTQSLFSESNRLMLLLCIPLLLLNILCGKLFLSWFGPAFTTGYGCLICISVAQFLFSLFGPANTILMMQDEEKAAAFCWLAYVVLLQATSAWFIPRWGITGGGMAILVSSLLFNILLAVVTSWRCGIVSPFLRKTGRILGFS